MIASVNVTALLTLLFLKFENKNDRLKDTIFVIMTTNAVTEAVPGGWSAALQQTANKTVLADEASEFKTVGFRWSVRMMIAKLLTFFPHISLSSCRISNVNSLKHCFLTLDRLPSHG